LRSKKSQKKGRRNSENKLREGGGGGKRDSRKLTNNLFKREKRGMHGKINPYANLKKTKRKRP